jgi:hypothetical protein
MNIRAVRSVWFFWFALTEGMSWKKRHGRYPRLPEIGQLVQKAVCKFTVASRGRTRRTKRLEIPIDPYQAWLQANSWSNRSQAVLIEQLDQLPEQGPKLSILMPVHDPPVEFPSEVRSTRIGSCALQTTAARMSECGNCYKNGSQPTVESSSRAWTRA